MLISYKCFLTPYGGVNVAGHANYFLSNMARIHASSKTEQRVVMKFLVNEGVKPSEIHRRLQVQ